MASAKAGASSTVPSRSAAAAAAAIWAERLGRGASSRASLSVDGAAKRSGPRHGGGCAALAGVQSRTTRMLPASADCRSACFALHWHCVRMLKRPAIFMLPGPALSAVLGAGPSAKVLTLHQVLGVDEAEAVHPLLQGIGRGREGCVRSETAGASHVLLLAWLRACSGVERTWHKRVEAHARPPPRPRHAHSHTPGPAPPSQQHSLQTPRVRRSWLTPAQWCSTRSRYCRIDASPQFSTCRGGQAGGASSTSSHTPRLPAAAFLSPGLPGRSHTVYVF